MISLLKTTNLICILRQGDKVGVRLLTQLSLRLNRNIIHCKNKLQHVLPNQFYSGRDMREWEKEQERPQFCLAAVCQVLQTSPLLISILYFQQGKHFGKDNNFFPIKQGLCNMRPLQQSSKQAD